VSRRTIKICERKQTAPAESGRSVASCNERPSLRRPAQERDEATTYRGARLPRELGEGGHGRDAPGSGEGRAPEEEGAASRVRDHGLDLWRIEGC
jgi:hypothetical protein